MIANKHPGVDRSLELLEQLRQTLRDFAAREENLTQEFSAEQDRLRQYFQEANEKENIRYGEENDKADVVFQRTKEQLQARHDVRKARIIKVQKAARQRALDKIEAEESRRKFEIQRDLLQTDRNRESGLKETEAAFETFTNELAVEREALAVLEKQVRGVFRGYRKFVRMISTAAPEVDLAQNHTQLLELLRTRLHEARGKLGHFRKSPLPVLFRFFPIWLMVALILTAFAFVPFLDRFGLAASNYRDAAPVAGGAMASVFILYFIGKFFATAKAKGIATALRSAQLLSGATEERSIGWRAQEIERIKGEAEAATLTLQENWKLGIRKAAESRASSTLKIDQRALQILKINEKLFREKFDHLVGERAGRGILLKQATDLRQRSLAENVADKEKQIESRKTAQWQALQTEWKNKIEPIHAAITAAQSAAEKLFPKWSSESWRGWTPPEQFAHAAKFAELEVDVKELAGAMPRDARLSFPGTTSFNLPLLITVPNQGSVLFETKLSGHKGIVGALNNIILRILSVAPPGRVNFTIIDPVELGQNFAGIMHLADYEDRLINSRIWTQAGQIEEQLANLNEHIEKVTQMYLRNDYATIAEYNEHAGRIAEKYHFLVVADFPTNFSDVAAKRLLSIAASGPRCGVYTLIHWDQRKPAPLEFVPDELRKNSVCLQEKGGGFVFAKNFLDGTKLRFDSPPEPEIATQFLQKVGKYSIDSNRVEMPFDEVAPAESELWSQDTTVELRVPVGRTGATKQQYLALGKGTRQHALIAGKTGSGKSTLFHVIITNLALWCSPEQVEFYLVDFKKGVEFKCYATHRLPHARVVAIESDREFGLSVLQRLDDELKRRGEMFRKLGVQDIAGYKKAGGTEPIPRTLLLIDEFQEFFVEDDKVSQGAALLLDRIVRQGRAFGIHVLLGSQTLGGAYTLARATLGQMVVRIALQCNEADAYLIMDEENPAPRLLSRPGEAIYNDTAGTIEGNSPFQIVWLPDEVRENYLGKVDQLAAQKLKTRVAPIIFEGNALAHVEENDLLRTALETKPVKPVATPRAWLGAPNSIKGPTEVVLKRQSGNNLLIVGQRDEAALSLLTVSLISLAAQHPQGSARFLIFDNDPPDSPQRLLFEKIITAAPEEISPVGNADIDGVMEGLAIELEKRNDSQYASSAPAIYLLIHGLQRFKKLRYEEDLGFSMDEAKTATNPGMILNKLITEGTSLGFHVICSCDTLNNVNRFLSRKALSEFEMRVLFQMSANDSASLIDSPKANNLGLHRAIFYNEQEGLLELFRPYALPEIGWMEEATKNLARLRP